MNFNWLAYLLCLSIGSAFLAKGIQHGDWAFGVGIYLTALPFLNGLYRIMDVLEAEDED